MLAVLIPGQVLICGGDHPDTDGNIAVSIFAIISGTYCEDLWPLLQFILFALINIPGLAFLFQLLAPAFNNAITGTVVGVGAALALVNFLVGIL